jgi:hypothetical protein
VSEDGMEIADEEVSADQDSGNQGVESASTTKMKTSMIHHTGRLNAIVLKWPKYAATSKQPQASSYDQLCMPMHKQIKNQPDRTILYLPLLKSFLISRHKNVASFQLRCLPNQDWNYVLWCCHHEGAGSVNHHGCDKGMFCSPFSKEQNRKHYNTLCFKQKRCLHIKGQGCADGHKQWLSKTKEETWLSVWKHYFSCVLDALQGHDVGTCDIPHVFMQADIDKELHMLFEGELVDLLLQVEPTFEHMWLETVAPKYWPT